MKNRLFVCQYRKACFNRFVTPLFLILTLYAIMFIYHILILIYVTSLEMYGKLIVSYMLCPNTSPGVSTPPALSMCSTFSTFPTLSTFATVVGVFLATAWRTASFSNKVENNYQFIEHWYLKYIHSSFNKLWQNNL